MPIPAMYASQVANDTGQSSQLFLDMMQPAQAALFPSYPNALVNCPLGAAICRPPAALASLSHHDDFGLRSQLPDAAYRAGQHRRGVRDSGINIVASASYEYVHGVHLIRSLDVNLPKPTITEYPVYNDTGSVFLGSTMSPRSATWQTTPSVDCPYPPCINPVQRPIRDWAPSTLSRAQSSSIYNGLTVSVKRQLSHGMYFQVGYTLAKAMDDGPDALVVGRPGNVQNAYCHGGMGPQRQRPAPSICCGVGGRAEVQAH